MTMMMRTAVVAGAVDSDYDFLNDCCCMCYFSHYRTVAAAIVVVVGYASQMQFKNFSTFERCCWCCHIGVHIADTNDQNYHWRYQNHRMENLLQSLEIPSSLFF